MKDEEKEKQVGRDRYKKLLRIIAAQTGGKYLPIFHRESGIKLIYCKNNTSESFSNAIDLGIEKGHIIVQMGDEGEAEYALTVAGTEETDYQTYPYREENITEIREIIEEEASKDISRDDIIEWGKEHIRHIRSGDHINLIHSNEE